MACPCGFVMSAVTTPTLVDHGFAHLHFKVGRAGVNAAEIADGAAHYRGAGEFIRLAKDVREGRE